MLPPQERGIAIPENFKTLQELKDVDYSPIVVANQTYMVLALFAKNILSPRGELSLNVAFAKYYLERYTLPYINKAKKGSGNLFKHEPHAVTVNTSLQEAAQHALVVFSYIPTWLHIGENEDPLSRNGIFWVPTTEDEFVEKIEEIGSEVEKIASGETTPKDTDKPTFPLLRTYAFFKVGAQLPFKISLEGEKAAQDKSRDYINNLLKDVEIAEI